MSVWVLLLMGEACLAPTARERGFQGPPRAQVSGVQGDPRVNDDAGKAFEEATALYAKREDEKALAAFDRAIALDAKRADFYVGRGRTLARLRRFDEALAAYGEAIRLAPDGWEGYRYRGHAYINTRKIDLAIADLTRAEALKKDDWNVYYHLALARYLNGDFAEAAAAYQACYRLSKTDDEKVAASAWLYPALRRAGRDADAKAVLDRITPRLDVKENAAYLDRLLLFKGVKSEEEVAAAMAANPLNLPTVGYGIGLWHLLNNRPDRAREYFRKATSGDYWPAFGHVASEIELKRMK
jgi:Flp pilus assembly protein TadD